MKIKGVLTDRTRHDRAHESRSKKYKTTKRKRRAQPRSESKDLAQRPTSPKECSPQATLWWGKKNTDGLAHLARRATSLSHHPRNPCPRLQGAPLRPPAQATGRLVPLPPAAAAAPSTSCGHCRLPQPQGCEVLPTSAVPTEDF